MLASVLGCKVLLGFPGTVTASASRARGVHVSQIRRCEAGESTPTLDVLRKLAIALSVSADTLVFDENKRGPDDDLRLQFEATTRLTDDEKRVVKTVIESIILNHEAKRWAA